MHCSIPYFFILSCHVYLMLCSILLCLRFELYFLIHLTPLMDHYHFSYLHLLPSFLLDPLSIPDKKGKSILFRVYWSVFVIFIWLLCTSLGGEILFLMHICRGRDIPLGRCIYQGGEDIELLRKICFVCFSLCLFSWIALCLFWTCIYLYAIVLHWVHVWMIIYFAMWSL